MITLELEAVGLYLEEQGHTVVKMYQHIAVPLGKTAKIAIGQDGHKITAVAQDPFTLYGEFEVDLSDPESLDCLHSFCVKWSKIWIRDYEWATETTRGLAITWCPRER